MGLERDTEFFDEVFFAFKWISIYERSSGSFSYNKGIQAPQN